MLNKAERLKILQFFRIYSIVAPLPVRVDLVSGRLNEPSRLKKWISAFFYSLFVLHALYKDGSLAYAYFFTPNVQLHQLVLHANVAMGSTLATYWYYSSYVRSPARFFTYASITLQGNSGGPVDPMDGLERHWTRGLREYSLQDLISICLPYMGLLALLAVSATMVYDPSMQLLLYAAIPSHLQNWSTFGICLLEEIRFLVVILATLTPVWQLQVTCFDIVSNQLRLLIQNGRRSVRELYKYLRCLQLYVATVNNINSYLIFTWKLMSVSVSIISGYAAIAHFSDHPIFGIMYYINLFDAALVYIMIYEKAFEIPELFGQAAACALVRIPEKQRGVIGRQILSIPRTAVRVGSFNKMEQESTLIFLDFVVGNIVNMLVA